MRCILLTYWHTLCWWWSAACLMVGNDKSSTHIPPLKQIAPARLAEVDNAVSVFSTCGMGESGKWVFAKRTLVHAFRRDNGHQAYNFSSPTDADSIIGVGQRLHFLLVSFLEQNVHDPAGVRAINEKGSATEVEFVLRAAMAGPSTPDTSNLVHQADVQQRYNPSLNGSLCQPLPDVVLLVDLSNWTRIQSHFFQVGQTVALRGVASCTDIIVSFATSSRSSSSCFHVTCLLEVVSRFDMTPSTKKTMVGLVDNLLYYPGTFFVSRDILQNGDLRLNFFQHHCVWIDEMVTISIMEGLSCFVIADPTLHIPFRVFISADQLNHLAFQWAVFTWKCDHLNTKICFFVARYGIFAHILIRPDVNNIWIARCTAT